LGRGVLILGRALCSRHHAFYQFPVVNPFDLSVAQPGGKDVFVVAFDTNAAPVFYSGYLGGSGDDFGYAIASRF
jgi:hypothetical protein